MSPPAKAAKAASESGEATRRHSTGSEPDRRIPAPPCAPAIGPGPAGCATRPSNTAARTAASLSSTARIAAAAVARTASRPSVGGGAGGACGRARRAAALRRMTGSLARRNVSCCSPATLRRGFLLEPMIKDPVLNFKGNAHLKRTGIVVGLPKATYHAYCSMH